MNFLKKHYKYILFCAIFAVINTMFIFINIGYLGRKRAIILMSLVVLYIFLCALGFYLKEKKGFKTHQLFLVFALVLGVIATFALPLSMAPDEINHFRRAYEITNGHFVSARDEQGCGGNYLPEAISTINDTFEDKFNSNIGEYNYGQSINALKESIDDNNYTFQVFGNTSLYSAAPYLPQIIGIGIGRIFNLPVFVCMYIARLFNLLFWVTVIYFAIKFIPTGKSLICLLMLSPISLQAAASCQIDAFTNAAIIGMIAFVFYKMKNPTLLSRREKIVAVALSIALALSKIVYLPICLLLILLPKSCFKSRKDKIIKLIALISVATILNLVWLIIASGYLIEFQPGVDSPAQVHFILSHPLDYLAVVFRTYANNGLGFLLDSLGPKLGYFHIDISRTYIVSLLLFLFYAYLSENKEQLKLTPRQKVFITVVLLMVVALISTSLYVQWTALEAATINGLQGRYFTALMPLAFFLIAPLSSKKVTLQPTYIFAFISAVELYAISSVVAFYL